MKINCKHQLKHYNCVKFVFSQNILRSDPLEKKENICIYLSTYAHIANAMHARKHKCLHKVNCKHQLKHYNHAKFVSSQNTLCSYPLKKCICISAYAYTANAMEANKHKYLTSEIE